MRQSIIAERIPMSLPDVAPWFDNVSDGYEELPSADNDVSYDE